MWVFRCLCEYVRKIIARSAHVIVCIITFTSTALEIKLKIVLEVQEQFQSQFMFWSHLQQIYILGKTKEKNKNTNKKLHVNKWSVPAMMSLTSVSLETPFKTLTPASPARNTAQHPAGFHSNPDPAIERRLPAGPDTTSEWENAYRGPPASRTHRRFQYLTHKDCRWATHWRYELNQTPQSCASLCHNNSTSEYHTITSRLQISSCQCCEVKHAGIEHFTRQKQRESRNMLLDQHVCLVKWSKPLWRAEGGVRGSECFLSSSSDMNTHHSQLISELLDDTLMSSSQRYHIKHPQTVTQHNTNHIIEWQQSFTQNGQTNDTHTQTDKQIH